MKTKKSEKSKDIVVNEDKVIDVEVKKEDDKKISVKKKIAPKLFIKPSDRITIKVTGYYDNMDGEFVFVVPDNINSELPQVDSLEDLWTAVKHEFVFTRISYDRLNRYRNNSMIYNSEANNNTINLIKLRDFFLVYHLVDWNLTDEDGQKIPLKFDANGALSDESLSLIYSLQPMVLDLIFSLLEKKMNIS